MNESLVLILLLTLISLTLLLFGKRLFQSIFNPCLCWVLGFILPAFTVFLNSELVFFIDFKSWFYIFTLSTLTFIAGSLAGSVKNSINTTPLLSQNELWSEPFTKKTILCCFLISLIGFSINLYHTYGIFHSFLPPKGKMRIWESAFGGINPIFNYIYFLIGIPYILSGMYLNIYKKKIWIWLIRYLSLALTFFHGIRGTIINIVLIDFIFNQLFLCFRSDKSTFAKHLIKSILLTSFIILFAFIYVTITRTGAGYSDIKFNSETFLSYFNFNYINLQIQLQNTGDYHYGAYTLQPFYNFFNFLLTLKNLNIFLFDYPDVPLLDERFNSGTILRQFVVDFGPMGIGIGSFLISFILSAAFNVSSKKKSIVSIFCYSVFFSQTLLSFFLFELIRLQFVFWIAVIAALDAIYNRYSKPLNLSGHKFNTR